MSRRLNRRTFLRGAGGAALALPWLESMLQPRAARGAPGDFPMRLIVFFSNNGTIHDNWRPIGSENDFQLSEILAPLSAHKSRLLIMDGIDMECSYHGLESGMPHHWIASMLTGTELIASGPNNWALGGGISLDQYLGQQLGADTKFPTLDIGIQAQQFSGNIQAHMSYAGSGQPIPREDDPTQTFDRIFGDLEVDPGGLREQTTKRQLVLDAVKGDIDRLRPQLGTADKVRLERHLDAVREIERQLDANVGGLGGACQLPQITDPVGGGNMYRDDIFPELGKAMTDMLVMGLACDLTRVSTMQWREALGGGQVATWLGQNEEHHEISHKPHSDPVAKQEMTDVNRWYAEQLAYLCDQLDAVPEGDGTLLDNTLILWCNELSVGNAHSRRDMPYVMVGDAQGYFRTGRYLSYGGDPHNNLLVSIANAMGSNINVFGDPQYCTGPLSRLV